MLFLEGTRAREGKKAREGNFQDVPPLVCNPERYKIFHGGKCSVLSTL